VWFDCSWVAPARTPPTCMTIPESPLYLSLFSCRTRRQDAHRGIFLLHVVTYLLPPSGSLLVLPSSLFIGPLCTQLMGSFSSRNCLYERINIGNACMNNKWLNLACNIWTKHWHMNMWMWGTTTSCMHAIVTRTHARKNMHDTLMHACPSTGWNTHGHAQVLNLHLHAYTYSARVS
jgi:hypothetical protein